MRHFPFCDRRIRIIVSLLVLATGCRTPRSQPTTWNDSSSYYNRMAARVAYPEAGPSPVAATEEPRSIREPRPEEAWQLSLYEAIHIGMTNNKMILVNSEFLSEGNRLLRNPDLTPSIFDLAIQDSGILVGDRGTQAALSDFDPRFTTNMLWGRDETIQNNLFLSGGLPPGETLVDENAAFNARLAKTFTTGGEVALTHDWNYSSNNSLARLFPSAYEGSVGVELRQPLWAGSGETFTRIAGPIGQINERVTGVSQGVVIARINQNISLDDFEIDVRKQLYDIVNVYWDLYLSYEEYEVERDVRDRSEATWKLVKAKSTTGSKGGGAADEAQANEEYLATRARTEIALAAVWETEARLRRLMGLPANDGRLIRPCDAPTVAAVPTNWQDSLCSALVLRNEIRKQKSNIRSLELQLTAARSLVNPRLDFVAGYKVNGFGDRLTGTSNDETAPSPVRRSAYGSLSEGDQTSWDLGVVMSVPLGLRAERSQVRNLQLRVAKAKAALIAQELEVSHELTRAFNLLDRSFTTAGTNAERKVASDRRVNALEAEYDLDRISLDVMLRARSSQAESRIQYLRSIVEYNKAIAEIHYRSGTLPDTFNIHLADRRDEELDANGAASAMSNPLQETSAADTRSLKREPPKPNQSS